MSQGFVEIVQQAEISVLLRVLGCCEKKISYNFKRSDSTKSNTYKEPKLKPRLLQVFLKLLFKAGSGGL